MVWGLGLFIAPLAHAQEVGETVRRPEGWFRIEPPGTPEEGFIGALEVEGPGLAPAEEAPAAPAAPEVTPRAMGLRAPARYPCHQERARYWEELFRMAGIWDAPWALDLLEALDLPPNSLSPWVRFNLFGQVTGGAHLVGVDPLRPLAWDQELRYVARQLAACHRIHMAEHPSGTVTFPSQP